MVKSQYNITKAIEKDTWVYNTLTSSFIKLPVEEWEKLPDGATDDECRQLAELGILVKSHEAELLKYKYFCYSKMFDRAVLFLTIAPTMRCNFNCKYCFEGSNKNLPSMSDEVVAGLVRYIGRNKKKEIALNWFGGEPLMAFPTILTICRQLDDAEVRFRSSMVTNGSLLTQKVVDRMDALHLNMLQISLDGVGEEHDRRRGYRNGRPSFDGIISNLTYFLHHHEAKVTIQVDIDSRNPDAYHHVYAFMMQRFPDYMQQGRLKIGCNHVQNRTGFTGNEACFSDSQLHANDVSNLEEGRYAELMPGLPGLSLPCMYRSACMFAIDLAGNLYRCLEHLGCPEQRVGSVVDGKVSLGRLAETAFSTDPFSDPECVSCAAFPICGGGCPIDRIKTAGKPPKPYCSYHRQYLADMLPLFYERQKKH